MGLRVRCVGGRAAGTTSFAPAAQRSGGARQEAASAHAGPADEYLGQECGAAPPALPMAVAGGRGAGTVSTRLQIIVQHDRVLRASFGAHDPHVDQSVVGCSERV